MKGLYTYIGVLLFVITTACSDKLYYDTVDTNTFFKIYGKYYFDYLNSFERTSDGGFIFSGYTTEDEIIDDAKIKETKNWAFISRAEPNGIVVWQKYAESQFENMIFHDTRLIQASVYVSASSISTTNTVDLSLYSFDYNGNNSVLLAKTQIQATQVKNSEIVLLNNQTLKIITQTNDVDTLTNKTTSSLLIHDLIGDSLAFKTKISLNAIVKDRIKVVYHTDQTIVVGATTYELNENEVGLTDVRLIHIVNNSADWDYTFGEGSISESCSDIKIINNEIVVAGNHINGAVNRILLLKVNNSGEQIDKKEIAVDGFDGISCSAFDINNSGNYVFTGWNQLTEDKSDIIFVEIDADLKAPIKEFFGGPEVDKGKNIGQYIEYSAQDNCYFLAGQLEPITNMDICLIKLNESGRWTK